MASTVNVTPAMIDAQREDIACLERQPARAKQELRDMQEAYRKGEPLPI
jgi:hypothetical protein